MDYSSIWGPLHQIIGTPTACSYTLEWDTEVVKRAWEQKGLEWIKEENYVTVQFVSIRKYHRSFIRSPWDELTLSLNMRYSSDNRFDTLVFSTTAKKKRLHNKSGKTVSLQLYWSAKTTTSSSILDHRERDSCSNSSLCLDVFFSAPAAVALQYITHQALHKCYSCQASQLLLNSRALSGILLHREAHNV